VTRYVSIRGGQGLGDAIYVRAVAEHFMREGYRVSVWSGHRDVFIGAGVQVQPFNRSGADVVAHYVGGKDRAGTTQWQDVCLQAGVPLATPLRFDWQVQNPQLLYREVPKAKGRPLVLVHGGRMPMDRKDGFGREMLPNQRAFAAVLAELRELGCWLVQVGKAEQMYQLDVDVNLNGQTTVAELIDLASACDAVVAQCSFMVPLAEALDKPLLAVWAAAGLASSEPFIAKTTPQKVLSGPHDRFVMDDLPGRYLEREARAFWIQWETGAVV
jgi:hypothetical protein